jgi:hypothetical protein
MKLTRTVVSVVPEFLTSASFTNRNSLFTISGLLSAPQGPRSPVHGSPTQAPPPGVANHAFADAYLARRLAHRPALAQQTTR